MGKETILIIDSDLMILSGISKLLEREGYQTLTASNGSEGIKVIKEKRIDLIILDGNLLELEEIKKRRVRRRIQNLPAIIMRPRVDTEKPNSASVFKSIEYLNKPFKAEELMTVVKKFLQRSA
ncbi:MAG: response regulator [Candidatus Hadarchaeum sp.]